MPTCQACPAPWVAIISRPRQADRVQKWPGPPDLPATRLRTLTTRSGVVIFLPVLLPQGCQCFNRRLARALERHEEAVGWRLETGESDLGWRRYQHAHQDLSRGNGRFTTRRTHPGTIAQRPRPKRAQQRGPPAWSPRPARRRHASALACSLARAHNAAGTGSAGAGACSPGGSGFSSTKTQRTRAQQ